MAFIPKMAFQNLARHRKRTMITAGSIAYGLMMFIVVRSMLIGIDSESEMNLKLYETATGRIAAEGYWEEREHFSLEKSFLPSQAESFLEDSGASYTPRITFGGSLIFFKDPFPEDGSLPARFIALDPETDSSVFLVSESVVKGRWLRNDDEGVVIGEWLAEDTGARVGSFMVIHTQTKSGYEQAIDVEIVGILNSPNPEVTRSGIYMPLALADAYLEMKGTVTEVDVNFGTDAAADRRFAALIPAAESLGLEALDWRILGEDFVAISQAKAGGTGVIIGLLLIIAAVGISNTMLMAVYERVRELGMMRALGMKDLQIRILFLWEAAGIGILGGVMGLALGVLVNWPLSVWGLDYSFLLRDSNLGYRIQGQLFTVWDVPSMAIAFVLGVFMTVFVAVFSTHRILRLDIPASLRFQ